MSKNPAEIALCAVVLLVAFAFLYIFITTAEVGRGQQRYLNWTVRLRKIALRIGYVAY